MNILLLGGFFGSGKTTLMSRLTEAMLARGKKLCIVENEIGEHAIDDLLLKQGGIEITTIMGGCVCCQVTGSLVEALGRIKESVSPDWVLVELTGIAYLDSLRDTIRTYLPGNDPIVTVSVLDAARWSKLIRAAQPIVTRQLSGGEIILINKIDLNPELAPIAADIERIAPGRTVLPIQATADPGDTLAELLEKKAAAT